jgi:hypothetical protein
VLAELIAGSAVSSPAWARLAELTGEFGPADPS